MKFMDNTRVSDHRKCNRFYYFRHVRHLVPDTKAPPLVFGGCWHTAMDVVWKAISEMPELTSEEIIELGYAAFVNDWVEQGYPHPDDFTEDDVQSLGARTPNTAFFMLTNYIQRRRAFIEGTNLIQVEKPFAVPIYADNPDILYVGRLDKLVEWENRVWVFEHKTTTWGGVKAGISPIYAESFSPNSQIDGYLHAAKMLHGEKAKGVMVDAAFVSKTCHEHFMFLPIERSLNNLDAWLSELQLELHRIEENEHDLIEDQPNSFLSAYPKNTGSCIQFMRPCPYMDICKTQPNPEERKDETPMGFKVKKWEPFSVLGLDTLGLKQDE